MFGRRAFLFAKSHWRSRTAFPSNLRVPESTKRFFSDEGRKHVYIPEEEISFKAVRASGPGGQNVNKVSTAVELRFSIDDAWWLQEDEKMRLKEQQSGRVNKAGELIVTSQVGRTQHGNRKDAFKKLQKIVNLAAVVPKEHVGKPVITEKGKRQRKEFKQQRKAVKNMRSVSKDFK